METIRYLRRSSGFQPSDTWRPLLDEAFAKVATNSVSWSDWLPAEPKKSFNSNLCNHHVFVQFMPGNYLSKNDPGPTRDFGPGNRRDPPGPPGSDF